MSISFYFFFNSFYSYETNMLSNIGLVLLSLIFTIVFCLSYIWDRFFSLQGLPDHLPWAGASSGAISRAKAVRRSWFGLREMIQDGYYKVGPPLSTPRWLFS
jgi:hypothetical protein